MAITVSQFHTYLDAAVSAIGDADYATARVALLQAEGVLAGLPDGEAGENQRVQWRDTLDKLLERITKAEDAATVAASGQLRSTRLAWKAAEVSTVLD
jgi:hypothetical protein